MKESDTESVASNENNGYDSALDELVNESKPPLKMTWKQSYDGGRTSIITRLTASGKIDLLPDGRLFNNKSGTGIPVQDFFSIISQWNRKITEAELLFFKSIIHLLNVSEIKNKSIKVLLEEQRHKVPKKRWLKVLLIKFQENVKKIIKKTNLNL